VKAKCAPPQTNKHWQDLEGLGEAIKTPSNREISQKGHSTLTGNAAGFPLRRLQLTLAFEDIRPPTGFGSMHHQFRTRVEGLALSSSCSREILSRLALC